MGDRLLKLVAERLAADVRADNLVGAPRRRRVRDDARRATCRRTTPAISRDRLIETLSAPYDIDGLEVVIGASIGIAMSPGDGDDRRRAAAQRRHGAVPRQVRRRRRAPFLRARDGPPGAEAPRHGDRPAPRLRQRRVRAALPAAGRSIAHDRIIGFEALLRWRHPEQGHDLARPTSSRSPRISA